MCFQKNGNARSSEEAVHQMQDEHALSARRACPLLGIAACSLRYQSRRVDEPKLRSRLKELAEDVLDLVIADCTCCYAAKTLR
jgi:hypothetical protein